MKLDYHEVLVPNETPYESFQEHVNRYAFASNFIKDKVVLDIACGTGYGTSYLSGKGAKIIVGGDISKDYLKYAKHHYNKKGLYYIRLDAVDLPFIDECFDVIISFETIEHLSEYMRFLEECKRVLKAGGIIICSTPNKRIFSPHQKVSAPVHVQEFYLEEFHDLLREYFTNISLYGQRYTNLISRIKTECHYFGSKLIDVFPWGGKLKELLKRVLHYRNNSSDNIAKLGIEIKDEIIDKKYKVIMYRKSLFGSVPGCITAVAEKVKCL